MFYRSEFTKLLRPLWKKGHICMSSRLYLSIRDIFRTRTFELPEVEDENLPKSYFVNGRYICKWSKETEKNASHVLQWLTNKKQQRLHIADKTTRDNVLSSVLVDPAYVNSLKGPAITWVSSQLLNNPNTTPADHCLVM